MPDRKPRHRHANRTQTPDESHEGSGSKSDNTRATAQCGREASKISSQGEVRRAPGEEEIAQLKEGQEDRTNPDLTMRCQHEDMGDNPEADSSVGDHRDVGSAHERVEEVASQRGDADHANRESPESPRERPRNVAQGQTDNQERKFQVKRVGKLIGGGILIAGAAVAILNAFGVDTDIFSSSPTPVRLAAYDVSVSRYAKDGYAEKVNLELENNGTQNALLTRLELRVRGVYVIRQCYFPGAGELPPPGHYDLNLPATAEPGFQTELDPHRQVGPQGGTDRFYVVIGPTNSALMSKPPGAVRIYRLALSTTVASPRESVRLANVLLSVPDQLYPPAYYWPKGLHSQEAIYQEFGSLFPFNALACWRRNAKILWNVLRSTRIKDSSLWMALRDLGSPPPG